VLTRGCRRGDSVAASSRVDNSKRIGWLTKRRLEAPLTADQWTWGGRHATDFELEVQMRAD
jgi:hypothetical protein